MVILINLLHWAFEIAKYIIFAEVIMSWLVAFKVLNVENRIVGMIWYYLRRITEPVMKPVRKIIPPMGGMDFSPIIVLIGLSVLQRIVIRALIGIA